MLHHSLFLIGDSSITFLPLSSVQELGKKAKFKNLFDVAYFSNRCVVLAKCILCTCEVYVLCVHFT